MNDIKFKFNLNEFMISEMILQTVLPCVFRLDMIVCQVSI